MSVPNLYETTSETIAIELDREDARYRAGDRIVGAVIVASLPEDSRGIDLVVKWRTRGDGNTDTEDAVTHRLALDGVARGKPARIPFAASLPAGPVTYLGKTINVEWFVAAQLDLPWASDPKTERSFVLLPREARYFLQGGGGYRDAALMAPVRHELGPSAPKAGSRKSRGDTASFFAGLAVAAVSTQFGMAAYVLTPLFLFGSAAVLWGAIKRSGNEHMLGDPAVELLPSELRAGQDSLVRLHLQPRSELHVTEATVELRCTETTKSGSGSSTTTKHEVLFTKRQTLAGPDPIASGQVAVLEARVSIPNGAAPTFGASSNDVIWSMKVVLKAFSPRNDRVFRRELDEELVIIVQPG